MRQTRTKQAVSDEENVFYSGYHSTFKKGFPTDSGSERFKIDIWAEQRAVIRFYACLGKSPGETYVMIWKKHMTECLSKTTVNSWHKSYCDGQNIVRLGPRGGTKKLVVTVVKQLSRSGPREWRTVFVMMVSTLKKNHIRIVIAILNEELKKFALIFFGRGRRNSFYITNRISVGNLCTEVRVGSIDTKWTTEHTCFDGIPIESVACQYEGLTGFHRNNPCT